MAIRSFPVIQPNSTRNLFRQVWSLILIYVTATSILSGHKNCPEMLTVNSAYASTKRCQNLLVSLHLIGFWCVSVMHVYVVESSILFFFFLSLGLKLNNYKKSTRGLQYFYTKTEWKSMYSLTSAYSPFPTMQSLFRQFFIVQNWYHSLWRDFFTAKHKCNHRLASSVSKGVS